MKTITHPPGRLQSLDYTRGLIMVLLALESVELYHNLSNALPQTGAWQVILEQFFHKGWHGWRFWDLIQPLFMFMAGVSMSFSLYRQQAQGIPWNSRFIKILKRAGLLVFWGLFKRIHDPDWFALDRLDVTDILTQLAFTTLIAFFVFNWPAWRQVLACVALLVLTDALYRWFSAPGYPGGYIDGGNAGNFIDWVLFNQKSKGYVFINWLPTAVHTIAGMVVGRQLFRQKIPFAAFCTSAVVLLITGQMLDYFEIIPIIKPVASASFILVSLACCLLVLSLFIFLVDKKNIAPGLAFFSVFGMNAIFIYLFFDIVGRQWLNGYVAMVLTPVLHAGGISLPASAVCCSLVTFALEYGLCYFLYKRKIFFKL